MPEHGSDWRMGGTHHGPVSRRHGAGGAPPEQLEEPLCRRTRPFEFAQEPPKEDENIWLLTYLDLLTLIVVFFVLLLAYSQVNEETRQRELVDPFFVQPGQAQRPELIPPLVDPLSPGDAERLARAVDISLADTGMSDQVEILATPGQVELRLSEGILFPSGRAELLPEGVRLLEALVPLLSSEVKRIAVEGHTDDRPITTERFPSNWELSAHRATVVVRHLIRQGLEPERLEAVGLAATRPLADNDTAEGRARNRRVSLVVQVAH
ncbi:MULTISPECIES: OmpA family protein [unclassified Ectothiorhodospira]|uniref:OmpA/MotB family protein n=1 Tax=unclassified Ectothiorhodospira TaxID=2684909 RepID=UPI001EE874A9|nr:MULTISPECIES: OmpA family protein [unclassified Ectothiorhodospira]MCG5515368.1 OmpA family protein [Ectothiorhodospira sp. 9100]MCG5519246.1 OmpA family protein [Ectothiorhodospira sp. 9905]